jgi:hypothetical protein
MWTSLRSGLTGPVLLALGLLLPGCGSPREAPGAEKQGDYKAHLDPKQQREYESKMKERARQDSGIVTGAPGGVGAPGPGGAPTSPRPPGGP